MKKVTNTFKKPNFEWLGGGNPNAIENQEAKGQKEFGEASQLPRKCNSPYNITNTAEQYSKMGIKVLVPSKGDDIFLGVKLPKGWKTESTGHSMWNNLKDDKGRIRATIFYKATFYDRDSFINFDTRFTFGIEQDDYYFNLGTYAAHSKIISCGDVKDCGVSIFKTEKKKFTRVYDGENNQDKHQAYWKAHGEFEKSLKDEAKKYLNDKYPNWEDLNAYWD